MIDSGFTAHPDLTQPANRIKSYYDAVRREERRMPGQDSDFYSWHGTMTACTAAGNGFLSRRRFSSLAYDAELILLRTMNNNGRIPTDVICHALEWCADNVERYAIRIINLSVYADEIDYSLSHPVTALVEQLTSRGVVVVAAAGNDGKMPLRPPAAAPSAVTVGGLDDRNTMNLHDNILYDSSFGNTIHGQLKPDLIAPAIWLPAPILLNTATQTEAATLCALDALPNEKLALVLPLLIDDTSLPPDLAQSKDIARIRSCIAERLAEEKIISPHYKHVDGTSFAAPIVASVIAQMLEANRSLTPVEIKQILIKSAKPLEHFPQSRQGHGMLDAVDAVEKALRFSQ